MITMGTLGKKRRKVFEGSRKLALVMIEQENTARPLGEHMPCFARQQ